MEDTYIVAWALIADDNAKKLTDHWERCEDLEAAQDLYNSVIRDSQLYTASIAKEIETTG